MGLATGGELVGKAGKRPSDYAEGAAVVAQSASRGGPATAASRPLLWEHTEPNEFDSLLSSINHAMQNISPL